MSFKSDPQNVVTILCSLLALLPGCFDVIYLCTLLPVCCRRYLSHLYWAFVSATINEFRGNCCWDCRQGKACMALSSVTPPGVPGSCLLLNLALRSCLPHLQFDIVPPVTAQPWSAAQLQDHRCPLAAPSTLPLHVAALLDSRVHFDPSKPAPQTQQRAFD